MQAVIALCHFCETHGPRVVVTCQPMRSLPNVVTSPVPAGYDRSSEGVNIDASTSSAPELLPAYYGDCSRTYIDSEERCGACTSLGTQQCLLSNDHQNKTSYVTSQTTLKEEVHRRLKDACNRSLSWEVAVPESSGEKQQTNTKGIRIADIPVPDFEKIQEEEGHVSFGDAEMGMCLAYRFRIHDSKARGLKRLFSLLILTQDPSSLSVHHDFFLESLKRMKNALQTRAYDVFAKEANSSMNLPQRTLASVTMHHRMIRDKVELDTTRTLQVLTGSNDIFSDLHWCMMWTLRTQTMRFKDQLMEGSPTQDMLVLMEMQRSDIVELDLDQPNQAELTLQQLRSLRYISKELEQQKDLDVLIVHVITGGQIVVQSSQKALAKQFLLAISNLLPIGCLRINNNADRHYEPTEYNMMACTTPISIPRNVLRVLIVGEDELNKCQFQVIDRPELPSKYPKILDRFKSLILDDDVTISTLKATMNSTREEWLARAKLLYQLEQQALRDIRFREKAGDVLKFVIPATENDRTMLKFWQNGLAQSYRTGVINTIMENLQRQRR